MKAFASTSIALILLTCTYQAFAAGAAAPLKAQTNPYWWLLVIPGFIILWIVRTRRK